MECHLLVIVIINFFKRHIIDFLKILLTTDNLALLLYDFGHMNFFLKLDAS